MKDMKKKVAKGVVSLAKKELKKDVNSMGCAWIYQPKFPKGSEKFKK